PDVAHRRDEAGADLAELGPHPTYVDVDGPGPAAVLLAPDLPQELVAGEDPTSVAGEEVEELELLVGQGQPAALPERLVARHVDAQVADLDDLVGAEGRGVPVELPEPGVELGRHQGPEDEVVESEREVEAGEAGDGEDEEGRHRRQGLDPIERLACAHRALEGV